MSRRVQVCRVVGVLSNTCVGCIGCWEAGEGGFKSRCGSFFLHIFRRSFTHSYFLIAKKRVFFRRNLGFFHKWAFLKNYPFCDVTEIIGLFLNLFQKMGGIFFDFLEKSKKVENSLIR